MVDGARRTPEWELKEEAEELRIEEWCQGEGEGEEEEEEEEEKETEGRRRPRTRRVILERAKAQGKANRCSRQIRWENAC